MSNEVEFTWKQFEEAITRLVEKLQPISHTFDGVYGIPRGGLVLAVALSHRLKLNFKDSITRRTLIVDDISDTGETLKPFRPNFIATIHYKPGSAVIPNLYVYQKTEDWIKYPWEAKHEAQVSSYNSYTISTPSPDLNILQRTIQGTPIRYHS